MHLEIFSKGEFSIAVPSTNWCCMILNVILTKTNVKNICVWLIFQSVISHIPYHPTKNVVPVLPCRPMMALVVMMIQRWSYNDGNRAQAGLYECLNPIKNLTVGILMKTIFLVAHIYKTRNDAPDFSASLRFRPHRTQAAVVQNRSFGLRKISACNSRSV